MVSSLLCAGNSGKLVPYIEATFLHACWVPEGAGHTMGQHQPSLECSCVSPIKPTSCSDRCPSEHRGGERAAQVTDTEQSIMGDWTEHLVKQRCTWPARHHWVLPTLISKKKNPPTWTSHPMSSPVSSNFPTA